MASSHFLGSVLGHCLGERKCQVEIPTVTLFTVARRKSWVTGPY